MKTTLSIKPEYCSECGRELDGSYYMSTVSGDTKNSKICWRCVPKIKPLIPPPLGWECPRCHKIHAPNSLTCDCWNPHKPPQPPH